MDIVTITVMVTASMLSAIHQKKPTPKTAEQESAEAIGKYSSTRVH